MLLQLHALGWPAVCTVQKWPPLPPGAQALGPDKPEGRAAGARGIVTPAYRLVLQVPEPVVAKPGWGPATGCKVVEAAAGYKAAATVAWTAAGCVADEPNAAHPRAGVALGPGAAVAGSPAVGRRGA